MLAAFETAVGPAVRSSHGVSMPNCPTIIMQKKGHRLGEGGFDRMPTTPNRQTADAFVEWVWSHLEVPLRIRNECPEAVRVNWIHGGHVKELLDLKAREQAERVVFLAHTLHAERIDRKGHTISEGSSLLIHTVVNESDMVIRPVACLDLSSDCEDWTRKGECRNNKRFMATECPKSCNVCPKPKPTPPKVQPRRQQQQQQPAQKKAAATRGDAGSGGGACADDYKDCRLWASMGECSTNVEYMHEHCKLACGRCGEGACEDSNANCADWAKQGQCTSNADYMATNCQKACDICGGAKACEDTHKKAGACKEWAKQGQCSKNKAFMEEQCRRSCGLCCKDLLPECPGWKKDGHCTRNRRFMAKTCQKACDWCAHDDASTAGQDMCADEDIKCEAWQKTGECTKNERYMRDECPKSCGVCKAGTRRTDRRPPAAPPPKTAARTTPKPATPPPIQSASPAGTPPAKKAADAPPAADVPPCVDNDQRCTAWKDADMCNTSPDLMRRTCPKSCGACGQPAAAAAAAQPAAKADSLPCGDAISSHDCASMKRGGDTKCSTVFMHTNCRATCGLCGARGRDEVPVRAAVDARGRAAFNAKAGKEEL